MAISSPSSIFVHDFREAAPYIDYLRGKTLVIGMVSSLLQGATLRSLAADINLLASLGVKLVWCMAAAAKLLR